MVRYGSTSRRSTVLLFVISALAIPLARPCIADGALAIGIPPGGAKNGLASGVALDRPDAQTARQAAIESCHKSTTDSDEASKKACKVVETFRDKCYAIALDSEVRGAGAGWAVAETTDLAETFALQQCRNTSSTVRAQFCTVAGENHGCDGTAK
jgi:hypothetical protein